MARNIEELRGLSLDELNARLADAEEELANLCFQNGSGQLDSPIKVRTQRKAVARIQTLIRERETAESTAAATQGEA
ncbi:MAG: 50S ribosomal protein L29 [bacterium]